MTKDQALKHALEKFEYMNHVDSIFHGEFDFQINAIKKALAQKAEPVAMKFKIYKPTVPDPMRQDINDALLPWVYDQSRGSGFVASMWVTPVATLPPPRQPLTDREVGAIMEDINAHGKRLYEFARAIEAAHGIKE